MKRDGEGWEGERENVLETGGHYPPSPAAKFGDYKDTLPSPSLFYPLLSSSILFVSTNTFPFFSLKGFPVLASQAGEIHSHPVWLVVRPSYILKGRTRKAKYQRESTIINDMKRWTKSIDLVASTQI